MSEKEDLRFQVEAERRLKATLERLQQDIADVLYARPPLVDLGSPAAALLREALDRSSRHRV